VLALSVAPAAAAAKQPPSAVEQYTALAKEYVAKAQKLAEEVAAQAQETVSCLLFYWLEERASTGRDALSLLTLSVLPRRPPPKRPPPLQTKQAETYVKQANDYVQDAIKQITAKKVEL